MTYGSISQIGYPNMGLGALGLNAGSGYGSYDAYMPSMMGMNGSVFGGNALGNLANVGSMMGMYNPTFMAQYQDAMNKIEAMQAQHMGTMHGVMKNNEVIAHRQTDSALINKILTNSDVMQGIQNLYDKVHDGDQDGICHEFDKLRNSIINTYKDELASRGDKINPLTSATQIIETLYGQVATAYTGQTTSLRDDIKKHCDGALANGFASGFWSGNHERFVDETLNHCFDLDIDRRGSKDLAKDVGYYAGSAASVVEKGAIGAAAGAGLYTLGGGAISLGGKSFGLLKNMKFDSKALGKFAVVGAIVGAALDIVWKCTKD